MININKSENNIVILRLYELTGDSLFIIDTDTVIKDTTIISGLKDSTYKLRIDGREVDLVDTSKYPLRYNRFEIEEGVDITLNEGQGYYEIYLGDSEGVLVSSGVFAVDGPLYHGLDNDSVFKVKEEDKHESVFKFKPKTVPVNTDNINTDKVIK